MGNEQFKGIELEGSDITVAGRIGNIGPHCVLMQLPSGDAIWIRKEDIKSVREDNRGKE